MNATHKQIVKWILCASAIAALALLVLPLAGRAAEIKEPSVFPTGYWGPLIAPDRDICGLVQTILNVIYFAVSVLFFLLIPVYVMYGGFLMLTSMGSTEKVGEGKKAITGAIVGAAIGLLAFAIVDLAVGFVVEKSNYQWTTFSCAKIKGIEIFKNAPGSAQ